MNNIYIDLEKKLINNGYKNIQGCNNYYCNKNGNVVSIKHNKKKIVSIINVSTSKTTNGTLKFNVVENGKVKNKMLAKTIYETFKGTYEGDIQFIDGNKLNCSLDNLITIHELLESYRKNIHNI